MRAVLSSSFSKETLVWTKCARDDVKRLDLLADNSSPFGWHPCPLHLWPWMLCTIAAMFGVYLIAVSLLPFALICIDLQS